MELDAAHRDAKEAEQRHVAHERRLLADVNRERVAARQAATELAKEQKSSAAALEAARGAEQAARQALHAEKAAHNDTVATWSRKQQEIQVELATLRERAAEAEQRATDLAAQLQRQQGQAPGGGDRAVVDGVPIEGPDLVESRVNAARVRIEPRVVAALGLGLALWKRP